MTAPGRVLTQAEHDDENAQTRPACAMADAITELSMLPDGTVLRISITAATATLSASGMRAITLTLPAGCVTVGPGLSDRMRDLAELLADAHSDGEELEDTPWFFVESLLIAAGESGVEVEGGAR